MRAAIQEANATPGKDFIGFNDILTGTIELTGPLPAINSDIDIFGPGRDLLTIRRNTGGDYRILTINSGNVVIRRVTIANGKTADGASGATSAGSGGSGGGILHSNGSLELEDVNIIGNRTGNGGNTTESNSFGGDGGFGGGIASFATLTMSDRFCCERSRRYDGDIDQRSAWSIDRRRINHRTSTVSGKSCSRRR